MDASLENNTSTTVDGVRAIELFYRPIKETVGNETVFYQSQIRFNAPSMGVLTPTRYAAVLEASPQSIRLFELAFQQFLKALSKFSERGVQYDWISISMPIRYLQKAGCANSLLAMCKKALIKPERVCFELSPAILDETDGIAASAIKELTDYDFHVMITGIGGSCPLLKLGEFCADYIMLTPQAAVISPENERSFTCLKALVSLGDELGADSIVCDIIEKAQLKTLKELECPYYTGKLSGTFMAEKYVRARNSANETPES
ncbi:EAL domain-containing protein [uncultured Ruminococcus sp.]|uniref:EAL domain-containing protein n=1 Tax=uncultured Ruminococcus sp. TaxID=165186 RepID=UPI00294399C8|nr:EAL domain-containing protein [uncultured Ruminococcus sp.]